MKTKLFLLLLISVALLAVTSPVNANYFFNPGFEEDIDDDGVPDQWDPWAGGGGEWAYIEEDPEGAHGGEDYLEITSGPGGWSGIHRHNLLIDDDDIDVCIAAWIKDNGEATTGIYFKYEFYDEAVPDTADDAWKAEHGVPQFPTADYGVITSGDGQWHYYYYSIPVPRLDDRPTVSFTPVILGWDMGQGVSFWIDDVYGDLGKEPVYGTATEPDPADGAESISPDLDELSWKSPDPNSPTEPIYCDVWFTDDFPEYGIYRDDPNFALLYADKIVDNEAVESVTLSTCDPPIDLVMDKQYFWRVDIYEPNATPPNVPVMKISDVWTFDTINRAPVVDAGLKQNLWLDAGSASTTMDALVTDDGLPLLADVTLEWTVEIGPPVVFSDDTVEDPEVTFNAPGEYVLRLTADDTLLEGTDTVTVMVFEETYTGLVAHWKLDEAAGAVASEEIADHEGTLIGDPTWMPADGQVNGGLLLDGDGDYIEIPDSVHTSKVTWADELADELTLSIWMKTTDGNFGDDWAGLISKGSNAWRIQRYAAEDTVEFVITVTEGNNWVAGQMAVNDDKWHHIVGSYTGDAMGIYIDGVLQNSDTAGPGTAGTEEYVWIGAGLNVDYPENDFHFNGMIDEARIYEVGLPADRVLAEYIGDGGTSSCGGLYESADINQDCYINILDLMELLVDWMDCTDILNPDCS
jgi:hypothetical protein